MDILQQEQFANINCTKHPNNKVQFIQVQEIKEDKTLLYCQFCQDEDQDYKPTNYVLLNRIQEFSGSQIIDKWAPLQDKSLYNQIRKLNLECNQTFSLTPKIETFFENFKKEIVQKLNEIKKKMINNSESFVNNSVNILSNFQEISKTNELKQIFNDSNTDNNQKEDGLRQLIKKLESEKQKNTEFMKSLLQQYEQSQSLIDFQTPDKIKQSVIQLINQINIFTLDKNMIEQINYGSKGNKNIEILFNLISTKSNFCSENFLTSMKSLLNQISPLIEKISFEDVFIKDKKSIDFSKLNNYELELISDHCQHLTNISDQSQEQINKIKNSSFVQQIMRTLNLKSNYLKQAFVIEFEKYLIETYPRLKKIECYNIFQENQEIQTFQELSDANLKNIVTLIKKINQFQKTGNNSIAQTLKVKQNCLYLLKQEYLEEDLDQLFSNYPIFDLLNPYKPIDILQQTQMIKTNFSRTQQKLQIVKSLNNSISISQTSNGWTNCVSDFILDENTNYVFRFQFTNNSQSQKHVSIGLVRDSQKDSTINESLSCYFSINQNNFSIGSCGIEKKEKGDFSLLVDQKEVEMRVYISQGVLQMSDYPNYNHIVSITDEHKSKLQEYKNLRLNISLYSKDLNINLIYAQQRNKNN